MLIGHYGPAFAIKAIDKRVPLWMLFIAVQVPDIIWGIFILLGIEKANINPMQASNPLDLYYMPYSHGLLSTVIYSLVIVGILLLIPYFRRNKAVAWWLGAAIFSHWILDFISHRPDLPIFGDTMKIGLGLWNHSTWAVIVEVGIFLAGAVWYAVAVGGFKRWTKWLFGGFVAVSVVVSTARGDAMSIESADTVAMSALFYYVVSTLVMYFIEKHEQKPH